MAIKSDDPEVLRELERVQSELADMRRQIAEREADIAALPAQIEEIVERTLAGQWRPSGRLVRAFVAGILLSAGLTIALFQIFGPFPG